MTTAELQEQGAIYFDKITEGFRNYKDIKLVMDEKRALAHFKNLKKNMEIIRHLPISIITDWIWIPVRWWMRFSQMQKRHI